MLINEIEKYLAKKNPSLDDDIKDEIEKLHQTAIYNNDEVEANYCWCLLQIYKIQKRYVSAINDLKKQEYEAAWCVFDEIDINLSYLEDNMEITPENDNYHMMFIGKMVKEYQKLFPYHHYFSRECVIKSEECSICGKPISLRHPCGHKPGKLYMGELCVRKVVDMELKAFCIVTDPFDKYTYVKIPGHEYEYGILESLMDEIEDPYDEFYVETTKILKPKYKNIGRNSLCPCGSGKKYKNCHLGSNDELMNHYKIILSKQTLHRKTGFVGTFGTWKQNSSDN